MRSAELREQVKKRAVALLQCEEGGSSVPTAAAPPTPEPKVRQRIAAPGCTGEVPQLEVSPLHLGFHDIYDEGAAAAYHHAASGAHFAEEEDILLLFHDVVGGISSCQ